MTTKAIESETAKSSRRLAIPILFCLTAFVGASLIFVVQPLVSKLLLPSYGGAATVWSTSSFFFQVTLLLGYIFVHGTVKAGRKKQPLLQIPLVLLALAFLPLALPDHAAPEGEQPMFWLIRTLFVMIALPFLVLSTTGPLLQKWYSWTNGPRAHDPYFLYAASNVGSFFGLLSYPFLVEPNFTLETQKLMWSWGFGLFVALVAICAVVMLRNQGVDEVQEKQEASLEKITMKRQLTWIALAAIPSSLMLGVTTHMTTDVAAIPLLWVIPLAIYLATMVWAFGSKSRATPMPLVYAASFAAVISLGLTFSPFMLTPLYTGALLFITLALVAAAAHSLLAGNRPHPYYLTRYFVLVSLGGAIGGLFNGMLSPLIFPKPFEFPLVLALVPLLLLAYPLRKWVILATAGIMFVSIGARDLQGVPGLEERSRTFYGSYSVKTEADERTFIHGTTIHGKQFLDEDRRDLPTSYYALGGPLGQLFALDDYENVTAVGLGVGTVAAYGEPGMTMNFIEIDPEVVRIATDKKFFTYLSDSKANIEIDVADGRLAVENLPANSQDLIILDAFSSDSVPIHLLTQEAVKAYETKLVDDGVMAIHISNRVFDLAPVVVGNAKAADMTPLYLSLSAKDAGEGATGSTWMALVKDPAKIETLKSQGWKDLSYVKPVNWTDDYSSVLDILY